MHTGIEEKLKLLPDKSGVYIMRNVEGEIIYVGKAKVLKNRVRQYFKNHNHPLKVAKMVENIHDFDYIITDNENEALILENNLIKENNPKYNILLKDDKTYPFIKVTLNEEFPRIIMTRRIYRDGAKYFGPYCSNSNVKEILNLLNELFCLRKCKKNIFKNDISKPCLYFQLGQCSSPCSGNITPEEYRKSIDMAISFLNGKYDHVITRLNENMKNAADNLDFETAATIRDRISALSDLKNKQKVVSATGKDYDAIALFNSNDVACVEIFFVRSGKIVGKEHYFMTHTSENSTGEIISVFMKQYYENCSFIPGEILVQCEPDDYEFIESWLEELTDRNIKVTIPKIGDKYRLVNMIASNAKKEHSDRELKMMRDISFKNNALIMLQSIMKLETPPMNIEAYDISNISGNYKVGSLVSFVNGKPCKEKYKNFKIKYVSGQDDYACMREVIKRRIEHGLNDKTKAENNSETSESSFLPFPDVILVDGGQGHVDTVISAIKEYDLSIPVFGIVKDDHHKTDGLVSINGRLQVKKGSEAFFLISAIQDEMHRRAISYNRDLRVKSSLSTELLRISGVGTKKANLLLKTFKSVKKIKDATLEEIMSVPGVDNKTAKNVFEYFNGQ